MIRSYLALVGILYLGLAMWCAWDPKTTSQKVGFGLLGDSGRSEFLTVYGGLEFGMGLLFLSPLIRPEWQLPVLWGCALMHGSLVAFRSVSLWIYPDVSRMTWNLAVGEWVILLTSAGLLLRGR